MAAYEVDLDADAARLPPWALRVKIHGKVYAVRQPTLAEDEQLSNADRMKDTDIVSLLWSLFEGASPDKRHANRDTVCMLYTQLQLYRKARSAPIIALAGKCAQQIVTNVLVMVRARAAGPLPNAN